MRSMDCLKLAGLASVSALALGMAAPVYAQTDAALTATVDEIVVTATRREESLSRVPVSVSAYTQEKLDVMGIKSVDDVMRVTPGVNFTRDSFGSGEQTRIAIRGVQSDAGASTTGVYIDDTPIQIRNSYILGMPYPKVFDLQRVEVLRGPQGTLFGASSVGGAVRFIMPEASLTNFSARARVEGSKTQDGGLNGEAGFAIGGPIVEDKVGFRISAQHRRDGGWIDRVSLADGRTIDKNANTEESTVIRGALAFQVTDNLTISPSLYYQQTEIGQGGRLWADLSSPEDGQFRSGDFLPSPYTDEFYLPAVKLGWDLGAVRLDANTSYFSRDAQSRPDYTLVTGDAVFGDPLPELPGEAYQGFFDGTQRTFVQEVRLSSTSDSRLQWTVGAFYSRAKHYEEQRVDGRDLVDRFALLGMTIEDVFGMDLAEGGYGYISQAWLTDEHIALFGQVEYALTDTVKLTAGLRAARHEFTARNASDGPFLGVSDVVARQKEDPLTPKFGINYQPDEDSFYYATAAKGWRPGGVQADVPSTCKADMDALGLSDTPGQYTSESVWSYELGAKKKLANRRISVEGSLFYIDWRDVQRNVVLPTCDLSFTTNLGDAVSKGVDISIQARVTDQLTVSVAAGYTDATFTTTSASASGAIITADGDAISGSASPFTATVSAQYDFEVLGARPAYVRGDYSYRSKPEKRNPDAFGFDPLVAQNPATSLVSGRAGVTFDNVEVSAFVDNLFDSDEKLGAGRQGPLHFYTTFRPRTVGLSLQYRY